MKPAAKLWLGLRSLLWVLLLPGIVAGLVPWRFFGLREAGLQLSSVRQVAGLVAIIAGAALLLACVWEFAHSGRGTLSPADPPRVLVVRGLYRYVRNPMYLSVTLVILGETLYLGSRALAIYWLAWFAAANLFVLVFEEPALRRQFGADYERYRKTVPRWVPRLRSDR